MGNGAIELRETEHRAMGGLEVYKIHEKRWPRFLQGYMILRLLLWSRTLSYNHHLNNFECHVMGHVV